MISIDAIFLLIILSVVVVFVLYLIGLEWWLRREKKIANHVNWLKDLGLRETRLFIYRM